MTAIEEVPHDRRWKLAATTLPDPWLGANAAILRRGYRDRRWKRQEARQVDARR